MTTPEAIAELRSLQQKLDPERSEEHSDLTEAIDIVLEELAQLAAAVDVTRVVMDSCRAERNGK